MSLTVEMISPTACVFSLSATMFSATASACSRMESMARAVSSTACRPALLVCAVACADAITSWARLPICAPEWVISSTVAAVSCTAASCSSTLAACSCVEARISGGRGVEVLGRVAALAGELPQPVDHAVQGRAETPDLVLPVAAVWPPSSPRPTRSTKPMKVPSGPVIDERRA